MATSARDPGVILADAAYSLDQVNQRIGLGAAALRTARRNGLIVRRVGRRSFIMGRDLLAYIDTNAKVVDPLRVCRVKGAHESEAARMAVGWIKLHRKTLDSQAFSDPDLFRLWCYMLLRANYKPSFFRGEPIGIGQFAFTQRLLCDALAVSKGKIHRDLQKLVEMGSIAIKAGREFSVATICNWETYQDSSDETGAQDGRSGGDDGAAAGRSAGANGPLPKKERSKEPPPPTPSTDAEPAAASWEGVGDVLKSIKLGQRRELVEQLRQDGATPAAVLAIVEHWQSQPGAWEVGGLVLRLQRWAPGQAADDGFPPPSEAYQRDEARRRRLADSKRVAIETLANRAKFFADRQAAVESRKQEAVA